MRGQGDHGGAIHDALVALAVTAAGDTLITLDHRARRTYASMGIAVAAPQDLR